MKGSHTPTHARLDAGLVALELDPSQDQRGRLIQFINLLARWNRVYNLTSVDDPLEMVSRHLLDSLAVSPYLLGSNVLDLGTGAGLPGLPLAILEPERRFVLLDSNGKKVRFVRQATMDLGLANIEVVQARLESYRPGEKFATIITRAVADQETLRLAVKPLLASPGRLLLMKGRRPNEALVTLTPNNAVIHRLEVPFLDAERHLIEIRQD
ncbi:MAG: 16S rRNA (guanine(527)-N(7))-methyltransferase RsmG [Chromatiaceae bacterium]|nr:16S rRNA (guanine(527)-N(7))-methyltransferase RsmG [Chromatiaceae bacterium]